MKPSIYLLLLLVLISRCGYTQIPHTLTIADLQQLADCPDQYCLGSRVNQENYTYKGPQKGKNNGFEGTQYKYIRPHPNPMFTEFTASYWVMKDNSRRVSFTSDNKVWIAGIKKAIEQNGFTFVRQKGMFGDKEYVLNEGGRTWHLNWAEPRLLVDVEPHTLTVYSDTQPASQPTNPSISATLPTQTATTALQSGEPHLGGHWDADYPVRDAAQLLQAERRYAADYERGHGKTGNTFSRCEKVRILGKSKGQYRPLTTDRWDKSFDYALRHTNFDAFADNRTKLYKHELLVDVAGETLWMPIQEIVIKTLEKESKAGEVITLYTVLVSHHDFSGTLHLSFLINEFAAASTTDSFDPKPEINQPVGELLQLPLPTNPATTVSAKAVNGCGFNWIPWSNVSVTQKATLKRVMLETNRLQSLLDYIQAQLAGGLKIQIAYYIFDRQPCYLVYGEYKKSSTGHQGEIRCVIGLGQSDIDFPVKDLCAIRPSDNEKALIDEDNVVHNFYTNPTFDKDYRNFLKATNQVSDDPVFKPIVTASRLGANTPEELAMLLLKCLKTNDKATWLRCMHPDEDVETDELSARRFDQYRECLDERGITNWPLVVYSRMTHLARPDGTSKVDLTKTRSRVSIEFNYKNQEFVGLLRFGAFSKFNGKWLVWSGESFEKCEVMRSIH